MAERNFEGKDYTFSLTWNGDISHPVTFGLYFWTLPQGEAANVCIRDAIKEIVGVSPKEIKWSTGNGHGTIEVTY
jgi:hypothetical protein